MRSITKLSGKWRTSAILLLAACYGLAPDAAAQVTAISPAAQDQTCTADRFGANLTCTAGEFTTIVDLQTPLGSPTSCVAGSTLTLNVQVQLSGTNADRYDGGIFFGQNGNDPRVAGGMCSVGAFATTSTGTGFRPNLDGDNDTCGDYLAGGVENWQIQSIKVVCGANAIGKLRVPYVLSYQQVNQGVCNGPTSPLLRPGSPSKCNAGTANVPAVSVRGFVRLTKQTNPDGSAQVFNFTASGPAGSNVSPTAFTLVDNQTQEVTMDLGGAVARTLNVTEAATAGWSPTASIVCTNPTGGAAPYVTINNANRTISANLDSTNFGAVCTITNTQITAPLTLRKQWSQAVVGDDATVTVSRAGTVIDTLVSDAGSANELDTDPTPVTVFGGETLTLAEVLAAGNVGAYDATLACTGGGTLVGNTLTVNSSGNAIVCTYTNTRLVADLAIAKTNGTVQVTSGATTTYTITVNNNGPASAIGAVVRDVPGSGLNCPGTNAVTCSSTATPSACPAGALTVADLINGVTLGRLQSGTSATFTFTCTVL